MQSVRWFHSLDMFLSMFDPFMVKPENERYIDSSNYSMAGNIMLYADSFSFDDSAW